MKVNLDKIGSVTKNANISHTVEVSRRIRCEEGAIIAARVLNEKKIYNQLELQSGRMSVLRRGDIVALCLGNRRALKGFVGNIPRRLHVGDIIHVLNIGGVAGICVDASVKEVGQPLRVKVLGAISGPSGPLNINQFKLFHPTGKLTVHTPLILVSGTCMHVGKTSVACEIIKHGCRRGYRLYAAKLAGVAALRDIENMRDYGARKTVSFVDAGYTSTAEKKKEAVRITKGAIEYLAEDQPDFIVIEFGDGVYGEYGVIEILKDREIVRKTIAHIGCAFDQAGACELFEICRKIKNPLSLISGPVTDNRIGVDFIRRKLRIPAINALRDGEKLLQVLKLSNVC